MTDVAFLKMHGTGNDFVIVDNRQNLYSGFHNRIPALSNRRTGIGCDQFIVIEPSEKADCFMRIYNADGSESGACGNASRCVGYLMMEEKQQGQASIETIAGLLNVFREREPLFITVDMGEAKLHWREIPLRQECNTLHVPVEIGPLVDGTAVSMGNPHIVFFRDDVDHFNLATWGPKVETNHFFPEKINVEIAQILTEDRILLRVWERGSGETLACGTGACATLVAASRRGLSAKKATISLPGGDIVVEWKTNNHVLMSGDVALSFKGYF
ncbi:MAG: diaminopimelate epimerase [Alphaproteobacteria bacterium]|nr:diaminopimelate epimerase [Alphaproteobacteria bacterium]